jgi:hypothetical protein
VAPKLTEISMTWVNKESNSNQVMLSFRVNEPLFGEAPTYADTLLTNLNILQENVGACGIQPAEMSLEDYARTLHVDWEILPPGSVDEALTRMFHGRTVSSEERDTAADRFAFFDALSAEKKVFGLSGIQRYFGAILPSGIGVFENLHYGNAVYIFFSDWERLSQLSRVELLSGRQGQEVVRVVHMPGWKGTVQKIINTRLEKGA